MCEKNLQEAPSRKRDEKRWVINFWLIFSKVMIAGTEI